MADDDSAQEGQWCFAWFEVDEPAPNTATKAALVDKNRWKQGATLRIGFMDGTPEQQALVKKFAVGWIAPGLANLIFSWVPAAQADIRISFAHKGSWSVIGTSCKKVSKSKPTMNFGWLNPGISDEEAQRVILHEFGHALGLIHEHQNPVGSVNWNKPVVFQDLSGPPNNWDRDKIERNMFETYPRQKIQATETDSSSIMMYPIPASWVNPPSQPVGLNNNLSATDRAFIKKAYP